MPKEVSITVTIDAERIVSELADCGYNTKELTPEDVIEKLLSDEDRYIDKENFLDLIQLTDLAEDLGLKEEEEK